MRNIKLVTEYINSGENATQSTRLVLSPLSQKSSCVPLTTKPMLSRNYAWIQHPSKFSSLTNDLDSYAETILFKNEFSSMLRLSIHTRVKSYWTSIPMFLNMAT